MSDSWDGEARVTTFTRARDGGLESDSDAKFRAHDVIDREISAEMAGRIAEGHTVGHGRYFSELGRYQLTPAKEEYRGRGGLGSAVSTISSIASLLKGF